MTLRSGVVRALIALVLLVGVVLVLPEFSKHLVPMPTAARTTSMEDVAITLEPERKDPSAAPPRIGIAKAYLTDPSAWHGGKQRRVTIETALPGLEPRAWDVAAHGLLIWLEAAPPGLTNFDTHWANASDVDGRRRGHPAGNP